MKKKLVTCILSLLLAVAPPAHAWFFTSMFFAGLQMWARAASAVLGMGSYEQRRRDYDGGSQYEEEKRKYRQRIEQELQDKARDEEESRTLDYYVKSDNYDYEVRYFLSRMLDLATSTDDRKKESVRDFVSDKIVVKFLTIILNPNIDLKPLINKAAFANKIKEKAKGRDLSDYIRKGVLDLISNNGISLDDLRKAVWSRKLDVALSDRLDDLGFLRGEAVKYFDDMGLSVKSVVNSLKDPSVGLNKDSGQLIESISSIVTAYFETFSAEEKNRLQNEFLKIENPTQFDVIAFALMHSGPGMIKLVQLFYQNIQSPVLKAALKSAEENVPPMPFETVRRIVEGDLEKIGLTFEEVFSEFDSEPVKSGSVAQVHRAVVKYHDENGAPVSKTVAVKVRRNDYPKNLESDIFRLKEAGIERYFEHGIFGQIFESMRAEGDFRLEGRNIVAASEIYNRPELKVDVVTLALPEVLPPTESVLVMDFVDGGFSVGDGSKTSAKQIGSRMNALGNLYEVWLKNALLGNGFIHADPNGGNAKVRPDGFGVFLDFGNVAELSPRQQDAIKRLIVSAGMKNTNGSAAALVELVPGLKRVKTQDIRAAVEQVLQKSDFFDIFYGFFEVATSNKASIPISLAQFLRGVILFKNQFSYLQDQIDAKKNPALKKRLDRNFESITREIMFESLGTGELCGMLLKKAAAALTQ
jgi:predicted unusual protein kinase regulating ubiquinone biosynthesis (AarF/ABC1/UbiB family)